MRNVYNREPTLRTLNVCESWHSSWNRKIAKNNPCTVLVFRELRKNNMKITKVTEKFEQEDPTTPQKKI